MRIAYVTAHYPPELGAASTRAAGLTRALARRGHEVHVFTLVPSYPWGRTVDGYRNPLHQTVETDGLMVHRVWTAAASPTRFKMGRSGRSSPTNAISAASMPSFSVIDANAADLSSTLSNIRSIPRLLQRCINAGALLPVMIPIWIPAFMSSLRPSPSLAWNDLTS